MYSKKEMEEKGMEKEKTYSAKHREYRDCMQGLNNTECRGNVLIKQKKEAYSMTECKNGFFPIKLNIFKSCKIKISVKYDLTHSFPMHPFSTP